MNPQNEKDDNESSSWFSSWFERDMRNDIHAKLNDFEERKEEYEEREKERRRFFQESPGFPFFPSQQQQQHADDFEDFLGGRIPRWPPPEFGGQESNHEDERRNQQQQDFPDQQQSIEDLHREMQSLFEAAFAGGNLEPSRGSWSSSSTVVSSSNGKSYTLKQDSKTGARVDLKLPKNSTSENISLEVLKDRPCLIRWKNDSNNETKGRKGQVLELGNSVDCSKLSASISEARRTLTVKAPPMGKENEDQKHLSLKPNSYPRPINVTKKE